MRLNLSRRRRNKDRVVINRTHGANYRERGAGRRCYPYRSSTTTTRKDASQAGCKVLVSVSDRSRTGTTPARPPSEEMML